ncbi:hypothetical protein ACHAWF_019008 [Thalassiosira exigua]
MRPLASLVLLFGAAAPFAPPRTGTRGASAAATTRAFLFDAGAAAGGKAKIPSSPSDRDGAAIAAVKAAVGKPRDASCPLIECEFPALAALNKLGDGSLRSSLEAEDANVAFVSKLVGGISNPFFGPSVSLLMSSSASKSLVDKVQKKVKGAKLYSLKEGIPEAQGKDKSVCVVFTPSSQSDYRAARTLAESGYTTVLVNGTFKVTILFHLFAGDPKSDYVGLPQLLCKNQDQRSVPPSATMAYYLKPLTYNSQVAGFLIRSYPSSWTVLDAQTNAVLGSFSDEEILVDRTNTPDLRESGRLVQKSSDERAIRARANM